MNNIYKLYVIKIAKWFMLTMPIIVLFYHENGLEMKDVLLLQSIYSLAIVALEIPSGYFADVWGRKNTIIIGSFMGVFGFCIYAISFDFWGFLIAEILLGFGQSFISGADSALLYDTLHDHNKTDKYVKYEGKIISIGNFAEAVAGIIGGFLATYSLRTPFYFQIGVAALAVPASFLLSEPKVTKKAIPSFRNIIGIVKLSLHDDKKLKWNIIFSSIIGSATLTMAWFVQPYFKALNLPIFWYGILWTGLNLLVGISSLVAHKIILKINQIQTITAIVILISSLYIALSQFIFLWSIPFLFVFYFVRGVATPVLKGYINQITESEIRATVLSIRNFSIRIIFSVTAPFIGYINDLYSISIALLCSGIMFLVFGLFSIIFYQKAYINLSLKGLKTSTK
ncbi:MAG: MFS transporter [Bacteroidetes bacterium GWF2_33_38]|nr:MAG: MFS transporter [Bacteroidetes bacterium GWF2_33_38]OFY76510.1 MAG: MFS transporter [Bacteroidetes bacterium RIFOXYA12_FULL_33_9]